MILIKIIVNGFYNLKVLELFQVDSLKKLKIKINVELIQYKIYYLYQYRLNKLMHLPQLFKNLNELDILVV